MFTFGSRRALIYEEEGEKKKRTRIKRGAARRSRYYGGYGRKRGDTNIAASFQLTRTGSVLIKFAFFCGEQELY